MQMCTQETPKFGIVGLLLRFALSSKLWQRQSWYASKPWTIGIHAVLGPVLGVVCQLKQGVLVQVAQLIGLIRLIQLVHIIQACQHVLSRARNG